MASKTKGDTNGVAFPLDAEGSRSTTSAGKNVWAAAVKGVDDGVAAALLAEKNWRHQYPKHLGAIGDVACRSKQNALTIARQGLEAIYESFDFVKDGQSTKFSEAMAARREGSFATGRAEGSQAGSPAPMPEVPYKAETLTGEALKAKVKAWADYGTVEPSVFSAIERVVDAPSQYMDLTGKYFVLLGAGSEMGPLKTLLRCGATVVAIRTRKPGAWKETIELAKASRGALLFPMREGTEPEEERAGVDLLTEAPEIRNWLLNVVPEGADVTVGLYIYLDSDAHVRASLACDAIMKDLQEQRGAKLAYCASPTVDNLLPEGARAAMDENRANASLWMKATQAPMPSVSEVQQEGGGVAHVNHGFSVMQGPNYALAKTMQNWRALLAREAGAVVSCTLGPPTRTESVTHNSTMKTMLDALAYMTPCESFDAPTASALLSLILIEDLFNDKSIAHPSVPLAHPWMLISDKAVHGGVMRVAFDAEQSTALGAMLMMLGKVAPYQ